MQANTSFTTAASRSDAIWVLEVEHFPFATFRIFSVVNFDSSVALFRTSLFHWSSETSGGLRSFWSIIRFNRNRLLMSILFTLTRMYSGSIDFRAPFTTQPTNACKTFPKGRGYYAARSMQHHVHNRAPPTSLCMASRSVLWDIYRRHPGHRRMSPSTCKRTYSSTALCPHGHRPVPKEYNILINGSWWRLLHRKATHRIVQECHIMLLKVERMFDTARVKGV